MGKLIQTPQEGGFAEKGGSYNSDTKCIYDGVPGYPKGTPDIIKDVTFDEEPGGFGKFPRADRKGE